jgi:hypothetical protein
MRTRGRPPSHSNARWDWGRELIRAAACVERVASEEPQDRSAPSQIDDEDR